MLGALRGLIFRSVTTNGLHLDAELPELVRSALDKPKQIASRGGAGFPGAPVSPRRYLTQMAAYAAAPPVSTPVTSLVRKSPACRFVHSVW